MEMETKTSIDLVAEEMLHDIVMKLMALNKWEIEKNPIEFDPEREDSQYTLIREDIISMLDVMGAETIRCLECEEKDIFISAHKCPVELDYPQQDNHLGE